MNDNLEVWHYVGVVSLKLCFYLAGVVSFALFCEFLDEKGFFRRMK